MNKTLKDDVEISSGNAEQNNDERLRSMRKFSDAFSITNVNFSDYHPEGENDA